MAKKKSKDDPKQQRDDKKAGQKIARFLELSKKQHLVPTLRDIANYAKENNLGWSQSQVSRYVRQKFPRYAETNFNVERIKYPLKVAVSSLGQLGIDLCWLGRTQAFKEYGVIQPKVYTYLVGACLLSRHIWILPVPKGKAWVNVSGPLENLIDQYKKDKGVAVTSISSDKERAFTSMACQNMFRANGIRHHTFDLSTRKNSVVENANRLIRQEWKRVSALFPSWQDEQIAQAVENNINGRRIQLDNGKMSKFIRRDVTKRTIQRFLKDREQKNSGDFWAHVRINPAFAKFTYDIGDTVRLYTKLTDLSSAASKRSEQSLSSRRYIIVKQAAYLRQGRVMPYYLVKEAARVEDPGAKTHVAYPESIQKIEP